MRKLTGWIAITIIGACLVPQAGCRICADCEDLAYPAYGGAWERTRRDAGRVGSMFDPAGGKADALVDRDQPPTPDELERQREASALDRMSEPDRNDDGESIESNSDLSTPAEPDRTLQERKLEDIQSPNEQDLRERKLDEIDIHYLPTNPEPDLR
jgi:hypothetical protein